MGTLLRDLSSISPFVIAGAFCVHLFLFFVLWVWSRRDLSTIASGLFDLTKGLKNQSLLDSHAHLSDQIDAFLADVNDVLDDPQRKPERKPLLERMRILDEKRHYLDSMRFDVIYNMARTMIEAYPLAGVLGTVLAIGSALQDDLSRQAGSSVSLILERFSESIWSTALGLIGALVLMFINSCVEPAFLRLSENRRQVRETVSRAKRELALLSNAEEGDA